MRKRTYRLFVLLAIITVIVAVIIAGYSLFHKYKSQEIVSEKQVDYTEVGNKQKEDIGQTKKEITEGTSVDIIDSVPNLLSDDSYFEIDFFDVGEGDSTLVKCDGHMMLVDGGPPECSSFLYSYLDKNEIKYLDYIICTHAHEDHVGGLAGALNYAEVGKVYAPVTKYDTRAFNSFVKYLGQQGKSISVPAAGDTFTLGSARVEFVGPVDMSLAESNENNSSIVVRIVYGRTTFLITGDAEEIEEQSILDAGFDVKSTILRVGHHGSYTSTSDRFLKAVAPEYCVISVGQGNAYDHPHDEVVDRINAYGTTVYRTDLNGDIICVSDGETVSFSTEK